MASAPLAYWSPGGEERKLRTFISHRYGDDADLYSGVIRALNREWSSVQDISLSAKQFMSGPKGGELPKLEIQAEIAARIYTSDVVIAPSTPGVSRSQWVTWEVQLAAIGYGIPILFVNHNNKQRRTRLVTEVEELGLPSAVCNAETHEIVRNVADLVKGRPTWAMRQEETDAALRFRGPPASARDAVLRRFPFSARLAASEPEAEPISPKRGFWQLFANKDSHP